MNLKMFIAAILLVTLALGRLAVPLCAADDDATEVDAAPAKPVSRTAVKARAKAKARAAAARRVVPPATPDDDADTDATPAAATPAAGTRRAAARPVRRPAPTVASDAEVAPSDVPAQANRPGLVRLVVPGQRRVRAVTLYIDETGQRAVVEDQSAPQPNSIVNVGRGSAIDIDFDGTKVHDKKAIESLSAVFYVFSGVIRLNEMELTPAFLKRGLDIIDTGDTPPIFRVEVLELDRIGDTEGRVLKTLDEIPFKIGAVNPIPLNVDVSAGKKVGVKLSIPDERAPRESFFLQFKAAKKGKFPVNIVVEKSDERRVAYSPQVRFSFVPNTTDMDTFANPTESLIGQINKYVERHAASGTDIVVPLRVKVDYR